MSHAFRPLLWVGLSSAALLAACSGTGPAPTDDGATTPDAPAATVPSNQPLPLPEPVDVPEPKRLRPSVSTAATAGTSAMPAQSMPTAVAHPVPPSARIGEGASMRLAVQPDALRPRFMTLPAGSTAPTALQVVFAHDLGKPIADDPGDAATGDSGQWDDGDQDAYVSTAKTVMTFSADVGATPEWTAPNELTYRFAAPYTGTEPLQAVLVQLDTRDGLLTFDDAFVAEVPAASLQLERAELIDRGSKLFVRTVFSAPVDPADVFDHVQVTSLNGNAVLVSDPSTPTGQPNAVDLRVYGGERALRSAGGVSVELERGVTMNGLGLTDDVALPVAPSAQVSARHVKRLSAMASLRDVHLTESSSGQSIEIVCDDDGASGGNRSYRDPVTDDYHWISRRCLVDEDTVADGIHITPDPGPLTVVATGGGFRLDADFRPGPVEISFSAGTRTVDGSHLAVGERRQLTIPDQGPVLRWVNEGRYLPRDHWERLAIQHRNLDDALLTVRHVPLRTLPFWISGSDDTTDIRDSEFVAREVIGLRSETRNQTYASWLAIDDVVADPQPGVYELLLEADGERAVQRVMVTDLTLLAKRDAHGLTHAWAVDAKTLAPRKGADVRLIRPSGQVIQRCTTNRDGHCALPRTNDGDSTPPEALVVQAGDDISYLRFGDVQLSLGEFDVDGRDASNGPAWRAAVYSDRGVYRPGDTVHVGAILRDRADAAPRTDMPVVVRFYDARGRAVRDVAQSPTASGLLTADLSLGDYATTGTWRAEVRVADQALETLRFGVEEFVPERMEVLAEAVKDEVIVGDPLSFSVQARYLFGGSAKGSRVELTCTVQPDTFAPASVADRSVGYADLPDRELAPVTMAPVVGKLDATGSATLSCPRTAGANAYGGTAQVLGELAVYEAGSGRTSLATATARLHPSPAYLALKSTTQQAVRGEAIQVDGLLVDTKGKRLSQSGEVTLTTYRLELERTSWWYDDGGRDEDRRQLVRESIATATLTEGRFTAQVTPQGNGVAYVVRVSQRDSGSDAPVAVTDLLVQMDPYAGHWWRRSSQVDRTPRPGEPTALPITIADAITLGQPATVAFEAPYAGRALITVETDTLVRTEWVDATVGTNTWTFTVTDRVPNVYVSALLLKGAEVSPTAAYTPDRAFGLARAMVTPDHHQLSVAVEAAKSVRSETQLTATVQLEGPAAGFKDAVVTLAAVDQGILSLTQFETPDPLKDLFSPQRLGIDSFETMGWTLARAALGPNGSTGGDAAAPPRRVSMVEPVSLWSGVVALDDAGRAQISMDLPPYRGELRLMAVVASPQGVGHADAVVQVTDPLVLTTTLPRFLIDGDTAEVPVFVTNNTQVPRDVDVAMSVSPNSEGTPADAVAFVGRHKTTLRVEPGDSATAVFRVASNAPAGSIELTAQASSGEMVSRVATKLPLQTAASPVLVEEVVNLQGDAQSLAAMMEGWTPGTETTEVWTTHNPYAHAMASFEGLAGYPYGCIEQTSSKTRAQLYAARLVPALAEDAEAIRANVNAGIDRIVSMQVASGGFGYWPGAASAHPWGSSYALRTLLDARDAGYTVQQHVLDSAADYLEREVESISRRASDRYELLREAESRYALARMGRADRSRIQSLLGRLTYADDNYSVRAATRWAQASLYVAGDRRHEAALRDLSPEPPVAHTQGYWWGGSQTRTQASKLRLHIDLFGTDDPGVRKAATRLANSLADRRYVSTYDAGLVLGALGRLVADSTEASPWTLSRAGRELTPTHAPKGVTDRRWTLPRATEGGELTVQPPSTGADVPAFAIVRITGAREDTPAPLGGSSLRLSRRLTNAQGKAVDPTRLSLGDRVFVVVEVDNRTEDTLEELAVTVPLPAGFEVDGTRASPADPDLTVFSKSKAWELEHLEVRDDRVVAFGDLKGREKRVLLFSARAVTAGSFTLPSADALAMYDADIWARVAPMPVRVRADWAAFYVD